MRGRVTESVSLDGKGYRKFDTLLSPSISGFLLINDGRGRAEGVSFVCRARKEVKGLGVVV